MASLRAGPGLASRTRDGSRPRRVGGYNESSDEGSVSSVRRIRRDADETRTQQLQQSKLPSRIPSTTRRPSYGSSQSARPGLNHQPQSWGSNSSGSGRTGTHPIQSLSGSSSSSREMGLKPRPNVLRRKRSTLNQDKESMRKNSRSDSTRTSSSSSNPRSQYSPDPSTSMSTLIRMPLGRALTESPTEIKVAEAVDLPMTTAQTVTVYPELAERYQAFKRPSVSSEVSSIDLPYRLATEDLPPPTPGFFSATSSQLSGLSGSPSTRFSESPGGGPYSRDTTPTSMNSQSPGLMAPMRIPPPRVKHGSPAQTRPPVTAVTRRRAGSIPNEGDPLSADPDGLASVRESLTSSSSNSTVRDGDRRDRRPSNKKRLTPPPPSPPPRKSSSKHTRARDESDSPSRLVSRRPIGTTGTSGTGSTGNTRGMTSPSPGTGTSNNTTSSTRQRPLALSKTTPPPRPSRDGTPDIQSQLFEPVRVIHSNLSSASVPNERRGSEPAVISSLPRSARETPSSSSGQDRYQQASRLAVAREASTGPRSGRSDAKTKSETEPKPTRTPSPNISSLNKTFGFFTRRKTAPEVTTEKKDKSNRKGPAAGTGHEGYGRLGAVRRRSSGASTAAAPVRGPMVPVTSSSESLSSQHQFADPFLRDRTSPVVIRGGEVVENHNVGSDQPRTDSSLSFHPGHSRQRSNDSKFSSEMSTTSEAPPRNTLWPSAFPKTHPLSERGRRPSDSSADGEGLTMRGTIAQRRSVQKERVSPEAPTMRLPRPINTSGITSPSHTSLDTNVLSDDSEMPKDGAKGRKGTMPPPKKLTKPAKSPRNWNWFSRSRNQPDASKKKTDPVPATVQMMPTPPSKHLAFYEIVDSSEQDEPIPGMAMDQRVKEALRNAEVYGNPSPRTQLPQDMMPSPMTEQEPELQEHARALSPPQGFQAPVPSIETPSPLSTPPQPVMTTPEIWQQPQQPQQQQQQQQQQQPPQQQLPQQPPTKARRRLQEVGRIPKVVSTRPEQASPRSFSRPFHRVSFQMPPRITAFLDNDSVAKGPSPPKPSTPELTQEGSTVTGGSRDMSPDISRQREFISFANGYSPPRKNSECTTITTTSISSGSSTYALVDTTAVIPAPNEPLAEDEIWDEYNDLLGDVNTRPQTMAAVSKAVLASPADNELRNGADEDVCDCDVESPTVASHNDMLTTKKSIDRVLKSKEMATASSVYSCDMTDRLKAAFGHETASPTTPFSVSKFVDGYGERNNSGDPEKKPEPVQPRLSHRRSASLPTASQSPIVKASPKRSSSTSRRSQKSTTSSTSRTSEDDTPLAQVNLRVGSMTVSKWLTFGHVLFSPAREQLVPVEGSLKRHSILVIDGLGNDDWSFYAAETYPAATFFNLSPRAPLPEDHRSSSSFPLSPPNHHQIQYTSHMAKFPFGPETFTTVVYRFPAAAPESHYRNIVTEACRVLRPGGFLELSILDVDLNNMGNRGRRQIRQLKERLRERNADMHLGSTADLMLRLLGRKGFVDIKTCRVGVPVASSIARTNSTSSRSGSKGQKGKGKNKEERSLADMMSDESEVADEGIAKMVSRVGRWWYTRCYESAAGVGSSRKALWQEPMLMRECEEWGTSLKLMVCHAKMPDGNGRARVASI